MKTHYKFISLALIFTVFALISIKLYAQDKTTYLNKLVVEKGKKYVVSSDNTLRVDTLIMFDKSSIVFNPELHGTLEVKVAIIGNGCVIISKGADGAKNRSKSDATHGQNGGNLTIQLGLERLGSLIIDTRGGNGAQGRNGHDGQPGTKSRTETITYRDSQGVVQSYKVLHPGEPGTDGSNATQGGNAGNGGNLLFTYSTSGFVPVFNQEQRDTNSITILHKAGQKGRDGIPGKARDLRNRSGTVEYVESKTSIDGHVVLHNLNPIEDHSENFPYIPSTNLN
ncbi:hypothetical protein [Pontibacter sp. H249]|uniref:hypothetical protein n=1 Tax=Pontibacter sp. H249 TaxID=3133420 RepID=UPI0030C04A98